MDAEDREIIDMLQRHARVSQQEMAEAVGLSQPAVAERVRKLEQRGVITGYSARVNAVELGKDVTAFIGVNIEHPKYFESFAKRVLALPDVLECHRVSGSDSYLLKVKTANTRSLDALLVEGLRTIPGVTRTLTTLVLASIKEDTHISMSNEPVPRGRR